MRDRGLIGALTALVGLGFAAATPAEAASRTVRGVVVDSTSRWGYGGDLIVTETTVETDGGETLVLHQLGGRVGDVATRVTHTPAPLPLAARVEVEVAEALAATGRSWLRVIAVRQQLAPPIAPGAIPFVRTTNSNNTPLFFESSCALIGVNINGSSTIPGDLELEAVDRALQAWNQGIADCSYMTLERIGDLPITTGFDGINMIQFREDRWCRPAVGDDPEVCHDPAAAALTFLTFGLSNGRDGAILDADIEINGVNFGLVVEGQGRTGAPCVADFENTLTHELGHLLGLDHTCYDGLGPRPLDGDGEPIPNCFPESQLPAEARDATMYNFQDCGETKKISLEADDLAGACAIYPSTEAPTGECHYPTVPGGFCAAGGGGGSTWWLVLLALLALRAPACSRSRRP